MVLETLLDQRYQGVGFDVRREGEALRVRIPRALQRDGSLAVTCRIGLESKSKSEMEAVRWLAHDPEERR